MSNSKALLKWSSRRKKYGFNYVGIYHVAHEVEPSHILYAWYEAKKTLEVILNIKEKKHIELFHTLFHLCR